MGVKVWTVGWSQGKKQTEGNTGGFAQLMASGEEYLSPQVSSSERTEQGIIGREYDGGCGLSAWGSIAAPENPFGDWLRTKRNSDAQITAPTSKRG